MKKAIISILILTSFICFGQDKKFENWTENEKSHYHKLLKLAKYVEGQNKNQISKDTLFDKFIFFDYVLNDTITERREKRLEVFDTLFYSFRKTIDSFGLENLDAKPVRFYKEHEIYKPFDEDQAMKSISGEKMYEKDSNVFAYYRKEEPETPLGTLLFEPETGKLVAWIMIDQGGYKYFLTFNLF